MRAPKDKNRKTTLPMGTAPRQTHSFINTKPDPASQISSHSDRKHSVSVLEIQAKKMKTGIAVRVVVKGS